MYLFTFPGLQADHGEETKGTDKPVLGPVEGPAGELLHQQCKQRGVRPVLHTSTFNTCLLVLSAE